MMTRRFRCFNCGLDTFLHETEEGWICRDCGWVMRQVHPSPVASDYLNGASLSYLAEFYKCYEGIIRRILQEENVPLRPKGPSLTSQYCKRGHPYLGENLYVTPQGERRCRTCEAIRNRRKRRDRARAA